MWVTGLRFIMKDGKRILQMCGLDNLGYDTYEGRIGIGEPILWHDVPLEEIEADKPTSDSSPT